MIRGDNTKFDGDGKTRFELVPWEIIEKVAEIYTIGASKYSPNGWKEVPEAPERYLGALFRHLMEYIKDPKKCDEDTKQPHIYQVIWNAIALAWFNNKEINKYTNFKVVNYDPMVSDYPKNKEK